MTSIIRDRSLVDCYITKAAVNRSLNFRVSSPLAVISGAGLAGLAASFELRARGFKVIFFEKRPKQEAFSRFNVINLKIETQIFLKKFNLLEKFENEVASKIKEHRYALIKKDNSLKYLPASDVSQLRLDESIKDINKFFDQDGVYSVPIGSLQRFLAEKALEAGVNIFGEEGRIVSHSLKKGVSKVQVTVHQVVRPDLFFIAEGAHSKSREQLDIKTREIKTRCTGENWIFGNLPYSGEETFVVSLIGASKIANVIFNAKSGVVNIGLTSDKEGIREQILRIARLVFDFEDHVPVTTVSKPVHIINRIAMPCSIGNAYCIGDSLCSSSPLAGDGGTIALTGVPLIVSRLLDDYESKSRRMHENFHEISNAFASKWIQKSDDVKKFCMSQSDEN